MTKNEKERKRLEKDLNEWMDDCYECSGYGDDYYTDNNGELVSRCSECFIHRHIDDTNQRLAELEE